jgi:branched-chain amino acid transport system permease protein
MGENILILAFVVVVIGGIGSIRGALIGAVLVGCIDTLGRSLLQHALREVLPPQWASAAGPAIASIAVYVFMAAVLALKPQGLFPVRA